MNQEKASTASPFSALSYQEQQRRWMEWRSRQLDYRPVPENGRAMEDAAPEKESPKAGGVPAMRLPNMRIAAPARHRELDEVLSRHRQAMRKAGPFRPTAID